MNLLEIKRLRTYIETARGLVRCVDGVDLSLPKGETLGLVGESGCGKTMTARSIIGMVDDFPGVISGEIWFLPNGSDEPLNLAAPLRDTVRVNENSDGKITPDEKIAQLSKDMKRWRRETSQIYKRLRGKRLAIIFQDPLTSLNPYWTVGAQLGEAVKIGYGGSIDKKQLHREIGEWFERVFLPRETASKYPHQLSGGMCQRIMIAISLASKPDLIIADEPTTGLDVTIQSHIIDLFKELKEEQEITVLLISHDMGLVGQLADQIAVMYCGRIVEVAPKDEILDFESPDRHPYTKALLNSIPSLEILRKEGRLPTIEKEVPDPLNPLPGCAFHPRCLHCSQDKEQMLECKRQIPGMTQVNDNHWVRCLKINGQ